MLTFRQFLDEEVKRRSHERALKLLNHIAQHHKYHEIPGAIKPLIPNSKERYGGSSYGPERVDPKRNAKFHPNTINPKNFKLTQRGVDVPVKKLRAAQDRVSVEGIKKQLLQHGKREPRVIKTFKKANSDTHIVRDGHHGASVAVLTKQPTIKADVYTEIPKVVRKLRKGQSKTKLHPRKLGKSSSAHQHQ